MYYVCYFGQRIIRTAQATKEKYYQDGSSHQRLPELVPTFTDTSPGLAYGMGLNPGRFRSYRYSYWYVDISTLDTIGLSLSIFNSFRRFGKEIFVLDLIISVRRYALLTYLASETTFSLEV